MRFKKRKRKRIGPAIEVDFMNRDRMSFENNPTFILTDEELKIFNDLGSIKFPASAIRDIIVRDSKRRDAIGTIYPNLNKEEDTDGED